MIYNDWGNKRIFKNYEIYGWASAERIQQYKNFVNNIKNGVIVEVGVYGGASLLEVCDLCLQNSNKLIGVDPWETNDYSNGILLNEKTNPTLEIFHQHMKDNRLNLEKIIKELNYNSNVELMKDTSKNASLTFKSNSIDLIYIDGSHDYDSVTNDLNDWVSKLKPNGVLWGDDYNWHSVKQAVNDYANKFNNFKVVELESNGWLIKYA